MSPYFRGLALSAGLACAAIPATAQENVMVVFDGSNSMWGQIEGTAKIEIARNVMDSLLGEWTEDRQVGLMAYGHRRRGDCGDIETLVQPGAGTRAAILEKVNAISPRGKTPLTDAVEQAARQLAYTDRPATVVLISDGLESCNRDPCALAEALETGGVSFTAHVVGFGLGADQDDAQLACIAKKTGGTYIQAANAEELKAAMSSVSTAVAEAAPEPEPTLPKVTVTGPGTAVGGSIIEVTWAPTVAPADFITVVPAGADEGSYGPYQNVSNQDSVTLTIPADEGRYEIRYMHNEGDVTLGSTALGITRPEVELTGPDSVLTGSEFTVGWQPAINPNDYVTIVPAGADAGSHGSYVTVRDATEGTLTAEADPGLYELRYVLNVDDRTLASQPIEITEPQVTVTAPETAVTGERFRVSWTGAVDGRDYVTIVPAGTAEGEYGNYVTVRDDTEKDLQAPAETGMYEVRYVLKEGRKTLASTMIEITEPKVTVTAPETAVTGERFSVSWTGAVDGRDYVTIVPAGTAEGEYGNYVTVRDDTGKDLQAPAETGMYEVRYVLKEGRKTLASTMIEITEPEVTVTAPETAVTGERFSVSWTGAVDGRDYVTIVPAGTAEGEYGNYVTVRDDTGKDLQAPAETGMYEVRYVLKEGRKTLASTMIEITEPEVTVSGPDQVRAGDEMAVSWTGTVDGRDYIALAPIGGDDGDLSSYITVRDRTERKMTAPETPGMYELRYVLREGRKVLARKPVEVLAEDAALNTGASLTAPETAAAGIQIEVGWSADSSSADQRITIAAADQAIFTWIDAVKITGAPPVTLTLPDTPGTYELRFLDVSNQSVLARKVITVE